MLTILPSQQKVMNSNEKRKLILPTFLTFYATINIGWKSTKMSHFVFSKLHQWSAHCLKINQNVSIEYFKFGILRQFLSYYKSNLSGNTVLSKLQVFKIGYLRHFSWIFVHFFKCSSLCSQCWMRLFMWFSNTVGHYPNWLECLSCLSMLSNQDNFSSFSGLSDL